jgi:hypothetical protein
MTPLIDTFLFFLSLAILFVIPGFFFLRALTRSTEILTPFETFLFSFGAGIGLLNFLMILLGKAGISFTATTLVLSLTVVTIITIIGALLWKKKELEPAKETRSFEFSQKQTWLFLALLLLTFGIKTLYLSHAILPTTTDLGHHMYWSKLIAETGKLPVYAERNVMTDANGVSSISSSAPIADFIIGEHLPFAAINILSHLDFLGAFPILFLASINILSLLSLVILARTVAENIRSSSLSERVFTPQNIALATLFLFGPLYTLSSPQEKFVSGGVVGNTLGNFLLPLILVAYLRAFREKRPEFLGLGFFLTFSLAYIHHLSTLMTLFALVGSAALYLLLHWETLGTVLRHWLRLFIKPAPLMVTIFAFAFFFLVAMPTYIEVHAVGTALGTPTKTTRTGLSFYQITFSSGEARVALGIAGLFLLAFLRTRMRYASAFLLGWSVILLIMTTHPDWLFIDIPSSRIGAYLSFPLGVLGAFALIGSAAFIAQGQKRFFFPSFLVLVMVFTGFFFASGSGSYDNSQTLLPESKATLALETFGASRYLAEHTSTEDVILKDHNYITADSWMKLFFLRDYTYPLSRGFFKRYEDNPDREQCTLLMISVPNTARGEKCYTETGTKFVVVNPKFDITPFEKSPNFSRIYASENIHVYMRTQ